jgi:hypothetical protein
VLAPSSVPLQLPLASLSGASSPLLGAGPSCASDLWAPAAALQQQQQHQQQQQQLVLAHGSVGSHLDGSGGATASQQTGEAQRCEARDRRGPSQVPLHLLGSFQPWSQAPPPAGAVHYGRHDYAAAGDAACRVAAVPSLADDGVHGDVDARQGGETVRLAMLCGSRTA